MKITYGNILEAKPALESLAQKELEMSEAIALARLIRTLSTELEVFFEKQQKMCEKYGRVDENSGIFTPFEEKKELFAKEHKELLETEFDADIAVVKIHSNIVIEAATILLTEKFISWENN